MYFEVLFVLDFFVINAFFTDNLSLIFCCSLCSAFFLVSLWTM